MKKEIREEKGEIKKIQIIVDQEKKKWRDSIQYGKNNIFADTQER